MIVVDASVAIAWCFEDETTPYTQGVLSYVHKRGAIVPALWRLEIVNVLRSACRSGRSTAEKSSNSIDLLSKLPIQVIPAMTCKPFLTWSTRMV